VVDAGSGTSAADAQAYKLLVFSHNSDTRSRVRLALGKRPFRDLPPLEYVECATAPVAVAAADTGELDLLILDGEAVPIGGMGLCRQLKAEVYRCPPVLVLTGRPQDAWLATWSLADAAVPHPIDPLQLADAVRNLLRQEAPTTP
jgi:DNA-binding response OmpR family regulator